MIEDIFAGFGLLALVVVIGTIVLAFRDTEKYKPNKQAKELKKQWNKVPAEMR